jgi:hypothetical protein
MELDEETSKPEILGIVSCLCHKQDTIPRISGLVKHKSSSRLHQLLI